MVNVTYCFSEIFDQPNPESDNEGDVTESKVQPQVVPSTQVTEDPVNTDDGEDSLPSLQQLQQEAKSLKQLQNGN